jgi:MFS transporter, DHA2 family, methylenomycin A resistance protein
VAVRTSGVGWRESAVENDPAVKAMRKAQFRDAAGANPATSSIGSPRWATPLTLAAMSLGYGVVQLDVTIVNTALHSIEVSLGGEISELQWIVSSYTIAFAALILTAGALGDRVGAKNIFVVGFAIFTAASLACALAPATAILIVARAAQGVGATILVPNSLALLNHAYPEREGARAGGWDLGGRGKPRLTAGPLASGSLIALVGWRSIFLVNIPIGLAALWMTWRYANETPKSPHRELDLTGQAAAVGALGSLAAAVIATGVLGLTDPWVFSGFAAFVILAALFLLQERRVQQPMLPLSLFTHRLFALTALIGLLVNVAFYGLIFVLSLYFQQVNGLSAFATGLAFVAMMGVVLPANLLAPRAAERLGAPAVIAAGAAIAATACIGLIFIAEDTSYLAMSAQLVAMGAGLGLLVPPLTSTLLGSVEKARSGLAAGVLNSTRQTGSVLGVALFGTLVSQASAFIAGVRISLVISTILLLGAAGLITIGSRRRPSEPEL